MGVSLEHVQSKFASIIGELNDTPLVLSEFAIWLDLSLAEYKLKGAISLECSGEKPDPVWLKGHVNKDAVSVKDIISQSNEPLVHCKYKRKRTKPGLFTPQRSSRLRNNSILDDETQKFYAAAALADTPFADTDMTEGSATLTPSSVPGCHGYDSEIDNSGCSEQDADNQVLPDEIVVKRQPNSNELRVFPIKNISRRASPRSGRGRKRTAAETGFTLRSHRQPVSLLSPVLKTRRTSAASSSSTQDSSFDQSSASKLSPHHDPSRATFDNNSNFETGEVEEKVDDSTKLFPTDYANATASTSTVFPQSQKIISEEEDVDDCAGAMSSQDYIPPVPDPQVLARVVSPNLRGNYRSYTGAQKKLAVEMAEKYGIRAMAAHLQVPFSTLASWRRSKKSDLTTKRKPGSGRALSYNPEIDQKICCWILQQRELQVPVTRLSISDHAKTVINIPGFKGSNGWIDKFLKRNQRFLHTNSSVDQLLPEVLENQIVGFLSHLRRLRQENRFEPDFILNMDEIPMHFELSPDVRDAKDESIRTSGGDKRQATVVLCACASGKTLPPMVIYKGRPMASDDSCPGELFVSTHERGMMTPELMLLWLSQLVLPHTQGRPTLLVMDSYPVHLTQDVNSELAKYNIFPAIFPAGCSSKIQPMDVVISKPFRSFLQASWMEYVGRAVQYQWDSLKVKATTATREQMAQWVVAAWDQISKNPEMIIKSFKVCGISTSLGGEEDAMVRNQELLRHVLLEDYRVGETEDEDLLSSLPYALSPDVAKEIGFDDEDDEANPGDYMYCGDT